MTFNEKVTMKDLLSEGLYILMQQKPFRKDHNQTDLR